MMLLTRSPLDPLSPGLPVAPLEKENRKRKHIWTLALIEKDETVTSE